LKYLFSIFLCLVICAGALAGTSQLYTGDAVTVAPGHAMFQSYYDASFGGPQRIAGSSLTFGATRKMDVRIGYGYLWSDIGPDVTLGPNIGMKWRFLGDGKRKPSMALSSLYSIDNKVGGKARKNDYGGLLILQYPTRPAIFLVNYGRVWIGESGSPDLRYFAFAAARYLNPDMLVALEYSDLERIGQSAKSGSGEQVAAGAVFSPGREWSYSAQLAYLPLGRNIHWHMTLGVSLNF